MEGMPEMAVAREASLFAATKK